MSPANLTVTVELVRLDRGKCDTCGQRRVLYALGMHGDRSLDVRQRGGRCAPCAGIRDEQPTARPGVQLIGQQAAFGDADA